MAVLGILFLFTGIVMNVQVLRRPYRGGHRRPAIPENAQAERLTAYEMIQSAPWLVSAGLTVAGLALVVLAQV